VGGASLQLEGANVLGAYSKIRGHFTLGYGSTLGGFNQIIGGAVSIGRYCQIAPFAAVYSINHPLTHITSYVNARLLKGALKTYQKSQPVFVGNDVWIGHGAVILPGVTISDGVVAGASAVVTKDIPNYTIAVGNPAQVVKQRFSKRVIDQLLLLKWWQLSPAQIENYRRLFELDLVSQESDAFSELCKATSSLHKIIS